MRRRLPVLLVVVVGIAPLTACDGKPRVAFKELLDEDPHIRADAARRLGDARATDAIESLIAVLDDPDEEVRVTAIIALGDIGDPAAVPALAEKVDDSSHIVRLQLSTVLGKIPDPASVPPLAKLLYDPDDTIRLTAARSLGKIANSEALDALIEVALMDEEEMVRQHVVKVIGEQDLREAIPRVESALLAESDRVRANAARVLGLLGDRSSVPVLCDSLGDSYFKVRSLAAHSLADLAPDDAEVVASMTRRLEIEEHQMVRVDLAWSLAKSGDRSHLDVLRTLLFRGDPEDVRAEAAMALGDVGDKSDIPRLERAINDKMGLVREQAHLAVQKLKEA